MKKTPTIFFSSLLLICVTAFISYGQMTIKGTVTDESGLPLQLANIVVEGTTFGTATDADGKYLLYISSPPTEDFWLSARFIGYKTERQLIEVHEGTVEVNFTLEFDLLQLDQIVKTGTASPVEKKTLGNSIASVNAEELEEAGVAQIDAALSGKVPGALVQVNSGNPGGGTSVRLRGISTLFSSTSDPLYIVDGVILDNSATGVVNIGGNSSNRLADLDPDDVERIEVVKGAAAAALFGSKANNGVVQIFTKRGKPGETRIKLKTTVGFDQAEKTYDMVSYPYAMIDGVLTPVTRYDYTDDIFQTGSRYSTNLSISGGDANTRYFVSGSWTNQEGIIRSAEYSRENFRVNLDRTMTDWLNISLSANYIHSNNDQTLNGGVTGGAADGFGILTSLTQMRNYDNLYPDANGVYPTHPWSAAGRANPLEVINTWKAPETIDRIIAGVKFDLTPIENMSIQYRLGLDNYSQVGKLYVPRETQNTKWPNGYSNGATKNSYLLNSDLEVYYNYDFTKNIRSTTAAGMNYQYGKYDYVSASTQDLVPLVETLTGSDEYDAVSEYIDIRKLLGFYVQETVGLYDQLFVTASLRADAASSFGEDERWQIFPKFSFSYNLSDNEFWTPISQYVPAMKIRAALGWSGGQPADSYARLSNYATTSYDGKTGLINSSLLGNEGLKPERMKEWEIGTDIEFYEGRVGLEFTYFDKTVEDLILDQIINPSIGYSEQYQNVGVLTNNGIELLLRAAVINTSDFTWDLSVSYTTNNPIIDELYGEDVQTSLSWSQAILEEGKPPTTFYQRTIDYNNIDENGLPVRKTEYEYLGDPNPDWFGSFISEFTLWKDISARFQFDAVWGWEIFDWDTRSAKHQLWQWHPDYEKELKGELPAGYNNRIASALGEFVEDASFIKLREVSISYRWKHDILNSFGIRNLVFTLTGRNLFTITDFPGLDPETNAAGQDVLLRGWNWGTTPIPRSVLFSLTFNL